MTAGNAVARPVPIDLAALARTDAADLEDRISAARLVCFPTDTVYGVGGALTSAVAGALAAAKGRDPGKPLQVVFATVEALEAGVALAPRARARLPAPAPGAGDAAAAVPGRLGLPAAGDGRRGLRPSRPSPRSACACRRGRRPRASSRACGGRCSPPVPTLAARRRRPLCDEVDASLLASCDLALDAGPVSGLASSVVDLSRYAETGRWRLLRAGVWGEAEVAARLAGTREEPPTP